MVVEEISLDQYLDAMSGSEVEGALDLGPVLIVRTRDSAQRSVILLNSAEGKHARILA